MAYVEIVKAHVNNAMVKFTIAPNAFQNQNNFYYGLISTNRTKLHVCFTVPQNITTHFLRIILLASGKDSSVLQITLLIKQEIAVFLYCLNVLQVMS
jgi:hypothetical protein